MRYDEVFSQKVIYDKQYGNAEDTFKVTFWEISAVKMIIDGVKPSKKSVILDVGCGLGRILTLISLLASCYCIGIDLSFKGIKVAKNYAKKIKAGKFCDFIVADVRFLPFKPLCFDTVLCHHVLEHIPDDRRTLEKVVNKLKNEGKIFIATPNTHKRVLPFIQFYYRRSDKLYGHLRRYKVEILTKYLKELNLKVLDCGYYDGLLKNIVLSLPGMSGYKTHNLRNLSIIGKLNMIFWFIAEKIEKKFRYLPVAANLYVIAEKNF